MRTAIDTSVIVLLRTRQPGHGPWREALMRASREGPLIICSVAFAECSMGFASWEAAVRDLESVQIRYDVIHPEAAYLAGQVYLRYRRQGGPRDRLLPDFLIGAHAAVQADRLAATDRGYLRRYFPRLRLLTPVNP